MGNLIFYNSYKNETHGYIIKILSNIESILDEDLCENLKYYGKSFERKSNSKKRKGEINSYSKSK